MDVALLLILVALALVDSTSIGTLVVPIALLLSPGRPPAGRLVAYLAAIAGFYFAVGLVLVALAAAGADELSGVLETRGATWAQLVVGVALFASSWLFDSGRSRRRGLPDRAARWRDLALEQGASTRGLLVLAWTAGALELLTMVPYLAAIGLLVAADLDAIWYPPVLAVYCTLMVLPALVLLAVRRAAHERLEPLLRRIDGFIARNAESAIGWGLGIAGFLIAADAAGRLWGSSG